LRPLKRTIVHGWLIGFALWPAVHIGLVKRWDVNPWKLMGWGMYAAPQMPAELRITGSLPDGSGFALADELTEELAAEQYDFLRTRLGLGDLARPERLARAILDRNAALDGVTIEVDQPKLSRRTGIIEVRTTRYTYRR
jgi:hypothetical protein